MIGNPLTSEKIFGLGDHLREIMFSSYEKIENPTLSETQSMKSTSGVLWESLLVWYCNLCLIGTRSVVMRKNKSIVPSQFLDAITADYGIEKDDSEADLIVITFPNKKEFTDKIPNSFSNEGEDKTFTITNNKGEISPTQFFLYLNKLTNIFFEQFELGIISCKTPWNDFAVIPQYWDLVYSLHLEHPDALKSKGFSMGINGYKIDDLKNFFYAFVTLPSQDPNILKSNGMPIVRLRKLSGGNYWGLPSKSDVAESMKYFFEKNLQDSINGNVIECIDKNISKISTDYKYFKI